MGGQQSIKKETGEESIIYILNNLDNIKKYVPEYELMNFTIIQLETKLDTIDEELNEIRLKIANYKKSNLHKTLENSSITVVKKQLRLLLKK